MNILALSGSLRNGSYNTRLLLAAGELADNATVTLHDLADVPFYNEDLEGKGRPAAVTALIDAVDAADALLLATPEYNHSISGVLKNALDWASRPAFESVLAGKPTGIVTASMSPVGGARAQAHLKDILASTLTPVFPSVECLLPTAHQAFGEDGRLSDERAKRHLSRYVNGFVDWAARQSPQA